MEYTLHKDTLNYLKDIAKSEKKILVAFSGGKDSWCCLDLCCKAFNHVVCFFMYLIPGLECAEVELDKARKKYNVEIKQYPHWITSKIIKDGIYCTPNKKMGKIPDIRVHDVYDRALYDTGCKYFVGGQKESDGMWRKNYFGNIKGKRDRYLFPIKKWNKFDVLSYLKRNNIELPGSSGAIATGIDLSTKSLLWLYDNHPKDFYKMAEYFEFIEAVVYRREFYGVKG